MAVAINRMQFLRGDLRGENAPIRPPWALNEKAFVETCTGCGDCIRICPTKILKAGRGKFPQADFSDGACTFCADCVKVCEPEALVRTQENQEAPWTLKAHFTDQCLPKNGVMCRSCEEACEPRAIRFPLVRGGISYPQLDSFNCNGCGECYGVCPVNAIAIRPEAA